MQEILQEKNIVTHKYDTTSLNFVFINIQKETKIVNSEKMIEKK